MGGILSISKIGEIEVALDETPVFSAEGGMTLFWTLPFFSNVSKVFVVLSFLIKK